MGGWYVKPGNMKLTLEKGRIEASTPGEPGSQANYAPSQVPIT